MDVQGFVGYESLELGDVYGQGDLFYGNVTQRRTVKF